jgi:hypothetical protein
MYVCSYSQSSEYKVVSSNKDVFRFIIEMSAVKNTQYIIVDSAE